VQIVTLLLTLLHVVINALENGRLSDWYRIGTDTGCIVSATVVSADIRASMPVHQLLTGSHYTR